MVVIAPHAPTAEERAAGALRVREGEYYYEKATRRSAPPGKWRFVRGLGCGLQLEGWVRADVLATRDFPAPGREDFSPFLGDWKTCVEKLASIGGVWEDDRRKTSKIYNVTVFADEGIANVLSELKNGEARSGRRLIRVRRLQGAVYAIMWSENFCLSAGSGPRGLQWQPIRPDRHAAWTWARRAK